MMKLHLSLLFLLGLPTPSAAQHVLTEWVSPLLHNPNRSYSATFLGDLDQDGLDDFIVADAQFGSSLPNIGRVQAFSSASGALIWEVRGAFAGQFLGGVVANIGSIDGDSIPDLFITSQMGAQYFIRSGADGSLLHAGNGFPSPFLTVAAAGDVDGDSVPDYMGGVTSLLYFRVGPVAGSNLQGA